MSLSNAPLPAYDCIAILSTSICEHHLITCAFDPRVCSSTRQNDALGTNAVNNSESSSVQCAYREEMRVRVSLYPIFLPNENVKLKDGQSIGLKTAIYPF